MKSFFGIILLIINFVSCILSSIGFMAVAGMGGNTNNLVLLLPLILPWVISFTLLLFFIKGGGQKLFQILFIILGILNVVLTLNGFFGLAPSYFSIF